MWDYDRGMFQQNRYNYDGHLLKSPRRIVQMQGLLVSCALAIGCVTVWAQGGPVPEFYGIYALQDGKLTEMYQDANLNDFGPAVRFVFFQKGPIMLNKMFFLPPDKPKDVGNGQFKGWDDFYRQTQDYSKALDIYLEYGVPATAVEIPFQVGPYGGNTEMVRVVPRQELPPGFYQLVKGVRFWVRRVEVSKFYADPSPTKPPVGNVGTGPASQPAGGVSSASGYPISSGLGVQTRFGVANDTFSPISVFLDGGETPIVIRGMRTYLDNLEVGSTHMIKAVVGRQTFQLRFTVPRVMNDLHVTPRGIQVQ